MEAGKKEFVRVVCPQCNGTGEPCKALVTDTEVTPNGLHYIGFEREPSYCEGRGWIEQQLWKEGVKK